MRLSRSVRGFTLIELLVVVAIIALLISILLPALNAAKEQGRVAVCMANLRTIAQGGAQYSLDGNEDYPWILPAGYSSGGRTWSGFAILTEFIWGGTVPDKTTQDWQGTNEDPPFPLAADCYVVPARFRPMNKYLAPSVSWCNPDRDNPVMRTRIKAEVPAFFKCPSDSTTAVPMVGSANTDIEGDTPFQTWAFWGTSYPINWYWPYYYERARPGNAAPYNGDFLTIMGYSSNNGPRGLGRHMLKDKGGRWATEFVLFYENRFNYAMEGARPRGFSQVQAKQLKGWHKRMNYHTAAFLDGSARYQSYDTRFIDGPGWTTWPNRPWTDFWQNYNDQ